MLRLCVVSLDLSPGTVLDARYQIAGVLGSGGMGKVVAARHLELKREVAIKVLHAEIAKNPEAVARFMREARAAAAMRSDKVGQVLDVARLPDGTPYMVMDLLEGADLDRLIKSDGPLPQRTAVDYLLQACEGLAEAHGLNMVHRDLKPSNLFLTRSPNGLPLIKVLDFGIAKAHFADADVSLTTTDVMVGSPTYVSPEQVRSSAGVDPRSDIWSLGVTLYELLSNELPFPGESVGAVLSAIAADPPTPLPQLAPGVSFELWCVIEKCLQKDPHQRYQNLRELAQALAPFASNEGRRCVDSIERFFQRSAPPHVAAAGDRIKVQAGAATVEGHAATMASDGGLKRSRRWQVAASIGSLPLIAGTVALIWAWQSDGPEVAESSAAEPAGAASYAPGVGAHPTTTTITPPAVSNAQDAPGKAVTPPTDAGASDKPTARTDDTAAQDTTPAPTPAASTQDPQPATPPRAAPRNPSPSPKPRANTPAPGPAPPERPPPKHDVGAAIDSRK